MTEAYRAAAFLWVLALVPALAAAQTARPEDVGLSTQRLERIGELVDRHIEAGGISGAVTLVARHGRIAHLEAHGRMDLASRKAMTPDAIFRIASMSGTRWAYSALAGFDVLSRVVEIASGRTFAEFLRERVFEPLGMNDTSFWPTPEQRARLVTSYVERDGELVPRENPDSMSGERYFSAAGGLMTTARDYAQFAMKLANGGELNGRRILSRRSVELMGSVFIPDTLPGRRPGEGFGLGVRVITDPAARRTWLAAGSFGWSGAYGTHFWVDPKENLVGIILAQTSVRPMLDDFETMVMQAVED